MKRKKHHQLARDGNLGALMGEGKEGIETGQEEELNLLLEGRRDDYVASVNVEAKE